jgi:hypothetical protein
MSQAVEEELYTPARYLAVLSVVDYQGEASVNDLDFYAHAETSLQPEAESLENLGLLEEEEGVYSPSSEYRGDVEELGEFVQIDENGKWADIQLSDEEVDEIGERTPVIHWIA